MKKNRPLHEFVSYVMHLIFPMGQRPNNKHVQCVHILPIYIKVSTLPNCLRAHCTYITTWENINRKQHQHEEPFKAIALPKLNILFWQKASLENRYMKCGTQRCHVWCLLVGLRKTTLCSNSNYNNSCTAQRKKMYGGTAQQEWGRQKLLPLQPCSFSR